eukprot:SM000024S07820  [mRNA]  locus=s24:755998:758476:+ [translate_table: standard]
MAHVKLLTAVGLHDYGVLENEDSVQEAADALTCRTPGPAITSMAEGSPAPLLASGGFVPRAEDSSPPEAAQVDSHDEFATPEEDEASISSLPQRMSGILSNMTFGAMYARPPWRNPALSLNYWLESSEVEDGTTGSRIGAETMALTIDPCVPSSQIAAPHATPENAAGAKSAAPEQADKAILNFKAEPPQTQGAADAASSAAVPAWDPQKAAGVGEKIAHIQEVGLVTVSAVNGAEMKDGGSAPCADVRVSKTELGNSAWWAWKSPLEVGSELLNQLDLTVGPTMAHVSQGLTRLGKGDANAGANREGTWSPPDVFFSLTKNLERLQVSPLWDGEAAYESLETKPSTKVRRTKLHKPPSSDIAIMGSPLPVDELEDLGLILSEPSPNEYSGAENGEESLPAPPSPPTEMLPFVKELMAPLASSALLVDLKSSASAAVPEGTQGLTLSVSPAWIGSSLIASSVVGATVGGLVGGPVGFVAGLGLKSAAAVAALAGASLGTTVYHHLVVPAAPAAAAKHNMEHSPPESMEVPSSLGSGTDPILVKMQPTLLKSVEASPKQPPATGKGTIKAKMVFPPTLGSSSVYIVEKPKLPPIAVTDP